MEYTVEKIGIWILEALEDEWRREPDWAKCKTSAEVLGPLKPKYQIDDADITRALHFIAERRYVKVLNRQDGQAVMISDDGLVILAKIKQNRIEEAKLEAAGKKENAERRQDVRLKIYPIVISILALVIAYLVYTRGK